MIVRPPSGVDGAASQRPSGDHVRRSAKGAAFGQPPSTQISSSGATQNVPVHSVQTTRRSAPVADMTESRSRIRSRSKVVNASIEPSGDQASEPFSREAPVTARRCVPSGLTT